jgi:peptide/nickel transport system permease protein
MHLDTFYLIDDNMALLDYIVKRTILSITTIFVVVILEFFIFRLAPGDPALLLGFGQLDSAQIEELRRQMGLHLPLWQQFFIYMANMLQGNFGYSFYSGNPVLQEIAYRLPNTILLVGTAIFLAAVIGTLLGIQAADKHGRKAGGAILTGSLILYAVPGFWLGMLFLLSFAFHLRWFPIGGTISRPPPTEPLLLAADILWHLVLPVTVMTTITMGFYVLTMRASVLDELTQDYVILATAKGLRKRTILYKHVLRNSMLPLVTFLAVNIGSIFSGSVLVEIVFSWYGLGTLIFQAVLARDYPVLQAVFFIIAVVVVFANFVADILYAFLDPRVKVGR